MGGKAATACIGELTIHAMSPYDGNCGRFKVAGKTQHLSPSDVVRMFICFKRVGVILRGKAMLVALPFEIHRVGRRGQGVHRLEVTHGEMGSVEPVVGRSLYDVVPRQLDGGL
ncbi:hypothetical protein ACLOJK_038627 [Asimina triloba]